jgi:hypothetical protein
MDPVAELPMAHAFPVPKLRGVATHCRLPPPPPPEIERGRGQRWEGPKEGERVGGGREGGQWGMQNVSDSGCWDEGEI